MSEPNLERPRLRPSIDVMPVKQDGDQMLVLYDAAGLARGNLALTPAAFAIATMMDGENTLDDICARFHREVGQALPPARLVELLTELERHGMLEGPTFEAQYDEQVRAYRATPTRIAGSLAEADAGRLGSDLRDLVSEGTAVADGRAVVGLIAPHLDYARGEPCYAEAYAQLAGPEDIERFVILGTNHFGRSAASVVTRKSFETPLGVVDVDTDLIDALEAGCGEDLSRYELDHVHEHSVELQVAVLQALYGDRRFRIVPILCPDVAGPTGLVPRDGNGVSLDVFADALAAEIRESQGRTCVIAGADLSHVGRRFGDDCDLDDAFLNQVEAEDRRLLGLIERGDADGFVKRLQSTENVHRVCSSGTIYVLLRVLTGASVRLLRYAQAITEDQHTGVSCAAVVLTDGGDRED